jgi:cell wall-associated NlpC family hydrolase
MQQLDPGRRPSPRGRHHRRRLLGAVLGAAASTTLLLGTAASAAPAAPAAPVPAPARISGDRQSGRVADAAALALHARDVWMFTKAPVAQKTYAATLGATADAVAAEYSVDPLVVRHAWQATDIEHQTAVLAGLSELGTSYQSSTSSPGVAFDCSGLTAYAWSRAGVTLARQSTSQINAARELDRGSARAGDLVRYPGHVMMYLGFGDAIVHAANHESDVELDNASQNRSLRWGDPTG